MGQTSFRRHEFYLGLFMKLEKSINNVKGKFQAGETSARTNTKVLVDGGLVRSSEESSVMEVERRGEVIQLELPFTTSQKERRINDSSTKGIPITKQMVYKAFKKVKRNKGSHGVDFVSLKDFEEELPNNLYLLWNRLASGTYFPEPVREKGIPKKDGSIRKLGIPTISDRIAQQVIKDYLEPRLERIFHDNSYGYRPKRNAHQAIGKVRENTRKLHWVIDMDIKGFFDEVSHHLLMKALEVHTPENWVKMYILRWLNTPVLKEDGSLQLKNGYGTPQGGVISPLLANLFLHYVFDKWMDKYFSNSRFVRYADDIIVHTTSKSEAEFILGQIKTRMQQCKLRLHPTKTKIVFCKKYKMRNSHEEVCFDFLGYTFMPRPTALKTGQMFLGFDCAISTKSRKKISDSLRKSGFQKWTNRSIEQIAEQFNPKLQG